MIDFACKKIDINETIRCSLNLTKAEFKIFSFFMKNPAKRFESKEIAENLNLDISTVQRSMKKMSEKKIVRRSQINLENAGYTYSYCICDREEIKSTIKEIVDSWTKKFNSEIEKW